MAKELVLKEWLWQKIAREHNAPRVWGGKVDAIFAESEKAYKILMGSVNHTVITWVPKSQCEFVESNNETVICQSYEEAMNHAKYLRSLYC